MVTEHSYNVYRVLAFPRRLEFGFDLLEKNEEVARKNIIASTSIPGGSIQQRIVSVVDFDGNNIEVVASYDDLFFQSNSKKSIQKAVRSLFLSGEILQEIKMKIPENKKVFRFRKTYKRLTAPGVFYPIHSN
jgi:hypothetical protein